MGAQSRAEDDLALKTVHTQELMSLVARSIQIEQTKPDLQADGVRGTGWATWNAVTDYLDHGTRFSNQESRFSSTTTGGGADKKARALKLALAS